MTTNPTRDSELFMSGRASVTEALSAWVSHLYSRQVQKYSAIEAEEALTLTDLCNGPALGRCLSFVLDKKLPFPFEDDAQRNRAAESKERDSDWALHHTQGHVQQQQGNPRGTLSVPHMLASSKTFLVRLRCIKAAAKEMELFLKSLSNSVEENESVDTAAVAVERFFHPLNLSAVASIGSPADEIQLVSALLVCGVNGPNRHSVVTGITLLPTEVQSSLMQIISSTLCELDLSRTAVVSPPPASPGVPPTEVCLHPEEASSYDLESGQGTPQHLYLHQPHHEQYQRQRSVHMTGNRFTFSPKSDAIGHDEAEALKSQMLQAQERIDTLSTENSKLKSAYRRMHVKAKEVEELLEETRTKAEEERAAQNRKITELENTVREANHESDELRTHIESTRDVEQKYTLNRQRTTELSMSLKHVRDELEDVRKTWIPRSEHVEKVTTLQAALDKVRGEVSKSRSHMGQLMAMKHLHEEEIRMLKESNERLGSDQSMLQTQVETLRKELLQKYSAGRNNGRGDGDGECGGPSSSTQLLVSPFAFPVGFQVPPPTSIPSLESQLNPNQSDHVTKSRDENSQILAENEEVQRKLQQFQSENSELHGTVRDMEAQKMLFEEELRLLRSSNDKLTTDRERMTKTMFEQEQEVQRLQVLLADTSSHTVVTSVPTPTNDPRATYFQDSSDSTTPHAVMTVKACGCASVIELKDEQITQQASVLFQLRRSNDHLRASLTKVKQESLQHVRRLMDAQQELMEEVQRTRTQTQISHPQSPNSLSSPHQPSNVSPTHLRSVQQLQANSRSAAGPSPSSPSALGVDGVSSCGTVSSANSSSYGDLELCRHAFPAATVCGHLWLRKRGDAEDKKWKRRFAVLTDLGISYFKNVTHYLRFADTRLSTDSLVSPSMAVADTVIPLGYIDLDHNSSLHVEEGKGALGQFCFKVSSHTWRKRHTLYHTRRSFVFAADTDVDFDLWMNAIYGCLSVLSDTTSTSAGRSSTPHHVVSNTRAVDSTSTSSSGKRQRHRKNYVVSTGASAGLRSSPATPYSGDMATNERGGGGVSVSSPSDIGTPTSVVHIKGWKKGVQPTPLSPFSPISDMSPMSPNSPLTAPPRDTDIPTHERIRLGGSRRSKSRGASSLATARHRRDRSTGLEVGDGGTVSLVSESKRSDGKETKDIDERDRPHFLECFHLTATIEELCVHVLMEDGRKCSSTKGGVFSFLTGNSVDDSKYKKRWLVITENCLLWQTSRKDLDPLESTSLIGLEAEVDGSRMSEVILQAKLFIRGGVVWRKSRSYRITANSRSHATDLCFRINQAASKLDCSVLKVDQTAPPLLQRDPSEIGIVTEP